MKRTFSRAWCIGYALTYRHDPRPLTYAWAGFNRFEFDRDAPCIPKMANLIAKVDAAYKASKTLHPWDRVRTILRAEYTALTENNPTERKRHQRALSRDIRKIDAMEMAEAASGFIRKRAVTQATFTKWFHATEGIR